MLSLLLLWALLPLFFFVGCLGLRCRSGVARLVGSRRRHQLPLQPVDSVFQFAVRGFMFGQQPSVTRLQDVQRARHALHLLLDLFGVGALRCHLEDDTSCYFRSLGASLRCFCHVIVWLYLQVQKPVLHQNLTSLLLQQSFSIGIFC